MASIKRMLRGYVVDDREKNWTKEYAVREISKHKSSQTLDHPNGSVTTAKLCDKSITKEKLGDEVLGMFDEQGGELAELKSDLSAEAEIRKSADEKKADKATTLSGYGITDAYTKEETGQEISSVVNSYAEYAEGLFAHKAYNLIGYGITDAYTKEEVDSFVYNYAVDQDQFNYVMGNIVATKNEVNSLVGDIETAVDGIIALENSYIGGEGA